MCDPCCGPCADTCGPYGPSSDECHSRELRAGIMYTNCECWKRNGLQDQCPRSMCQGQCCAMGQSAPSCCPSAYPLKFAYMTMGRDNRRMKCYATAACCPKQPCWDPGCC
ncbi:keratin-associated protein 5-3-like [Episyrphus balteatus]|uniref:keratin-associated protein 5-3-like n=1 Tax=Episyrphus balteatus TaxID=286459 RepID=UPI002486B865|nr:keratin-associated protein 5-3-like [Episyrphus balteatus]